jgi:membrane-bound lytic murein transglycosylase D
MKWVFDRVPAGSVSRAGRTVGVIAVLGVASAGGALKGIHRFSTPQEMLDLASPAEIAAAEVEIASGMAEGSEGPVWDLPNLDHPRVDYWVRRFTTDKRGEFTRFLTRSGRYAPMISAKLDERGMPQDLIYLAMIESGFNPTAYSPAHASGLWQFISETGRRYGLDINLAIDERNDPVKSTDAALDYLTYLHGRFGSWYLAAAGYNTGENRVGRIMRQVTGSERGDEYSYYRIWDRLPRETRDYVPLMVAAARIAKEPERYGFDTVEVAPPLEYDEIVVEPATQLAAVAQAAGVTVADIRQLNPHFKLNRTRNDRPSAVRLPPGTAGEFAANWPRVRQSALARAAPAPTQARTASTNTARSRQYRVQRGDNLTVIARRHGVTVDQIRRANGLRGDRIRAGATLRIPG